MTDQEKRIKLAEAMGWTNSHQYRWDGPKNDGEYRNDPPDPLTDANDCHALITHLNGLGYAVNIYIHSEGAEIDLMEPQPQLKPDREIDQWTGDNWMYGVCELALKVFENERLLRAAQEPCPLG